MCAQLDGCARSSIISCEEPLAGYYYLPMHFASRISLVYISDFELPCRNIASQKIFQQVMKVKLCHLITVVLLLHFNVFLRWNRAARSSCWCPMQTF